MAKVNDLVVFVPYVVPGDVVDLQVKRKKNHYAEAVAVKFHEYSPVRAVPFCQHYGVCGGCKWQCLPYEEQIRYKQKQVVDNLTRIGKIEMPDVSPILGSKKTQFYRNKLEFTFSNKRWLTEQEAEGITFSDNNGTSRKPVYMKSADEDKPQKQTISVDGEDFAIEEVAENDLFLVTIAQGVIQTMNAPEVLSDTSISNFRLEKYVTAGGTQYDYADTVMYDEEVLDQYDDANMKDVTYNVILDAYGYMIGIEQNEDPDQYVFLTGIDGKNSNLSVRNADANVIFMDGNMDTVTVNMTKSDIDTTGKNLSQLNTWCTYTVNNDNVYTLKEVAVSTSKNVIDDDTDVAQYAQDVGSNGATIDKKHVSLKAANNSSYV